MQKTSIKLKQPHRAVRLVAKSELYTFMPIMEIDNKKKEFNQNMFKMQPEYVRNTHLQT